jgi:hypothetical protein
MKPVPAAEGEQLRLQHMEDEIKNESPLTNSEESNNVVRTPTEVFDCLAKTLLDLKIITRRIWLSAAHQPMPEMYEPCNRPANTIVLVK